MSSPRPSVTHLIPAHNGEALESLRAELQAGDEILVCDDGSTDLSREIARNWGAPVRVIEGAQQGAAAARNRGLAEARGDWIALLDADDIALPHRIAKLGARLLAADLPAFVYGAQQRFISPELLPVGSARPLEVPDAPAPCAGALLGTRSAFELVGPFDTRLKTGEMFEWMVRAKQLGLRFESVPSVVVRRRRHENNSSSGGDYRNLMLDTIRRTLLLRRSVAS
jgi:glycosyltransferase involved in cell wall biosynthesis